MILEIACGNVDTQAQALGFIKLPLSCAVHIAILGLSLDLTRTANGRAGGYDNI